jgi:hypothetical protein
MEKFKEKIIVKILNDITISIFLLCIIILILGIFINNISIYAFLIIPFCLPFAIISEFSSKRRKYTKEFILYIRRKIDSSSTLEEFYEIEKEFKELAIKNGSYNLCIVNVIKELHKEINNKIDILEKIKNKI